MKEIKREQYLNELVSSRENKLIKVITGIRRCGKSYLLDPIFKNYLLESGIKEDHIVKLDLDLVENKKYREPMELFNYVMGKVTDKEMYYILLDEIQLVDNFEDVLNSFLKKTNLDVYVTGSNSKFLSTDIVTEFRGRSTEIKIYPLSFSEFVELKNVSIDTAWKEYILYGGLPPVILQEDEKQKREYLHSLFETTYIKDIIERNDIKRKDVLDSVVNILASSVGSLTNPMNIYKTYTSVGDKDISINTITSYIEYIENAFLVKKVERYDVKGRKYISTPFKYYFTDLGLRNVRLNFRQQEENHIMENIIFNELLIRGYTVDVGVVETRNSDGRTYYEIDFICNMASNRYYIQSALNIDSKEKNYQESRPLNCVGDNFKKIIVVKDDINPWYNEDGILIIGIKDFLLNKSSLSL
ncbi:aTPase [Clostridium sp. CAG:762]|nr:aTPase [Clostridium sp. CAG:762]